MMKKVLFLLIALFTFGFQSINAQESATKIVTNHPDFKIKVSRCAASGKTVVIDMILMNEGVNDIENIILWACTTAEMIVTYDDQGNIYDCGSNFVKVANRKEYSNHDTGAFNIPTGVPMRLSVRIDAVSTSSEKIARLSLPFQCAAWGLNRDKPVKISNIPISRD